jgi:uncharacterized protein YggU (UPF0235/DUF167 family)
MGADGRAWRTAKGGISLLARVTPGSSRDGIDGTVETPDGLALKVRVRAVAESGKANRSVEIVVAEWLGLPKTRVTVARGGKSRVKTLDIGGDPGELEPLVAARIAALQ